MITYEETRRNHRLTDYKELKDVVIENTMRNIPKVQRVKSKSEQEIIGVH